MKIRSHGNKTLRNPVAQTCRHCGGDFYVAPCHVGKWAFCEDECKLAWRAERKRNRTRKCAVCGSEFETTQQKLDAGGGKYCSNKCQGTAMQEERRGEGNPAWVAGKVRYFGLHTWLKRNFEKPACCEWCGEEKPLDWALRDGCDYDRERDSYLALCRSCHLRQEYANGTRRGSGAA